MKGNPIDIQGDANLANVVACGSMIGVPLVLGEGFQAKGELYQRPGAVSDRYEKPKEPVFKGMLVFGE